MIHKNQCKADEINKKLKLKKYSEGLRQFQMKINIFKQDSV